MSSEHVIVVLYRPVGIHEWRLIIDSGCRRFPPRLPEQPIFYPVLTFEYAELIARSWNANEPEAGNVGIITRFEVDREFVRRYPVQLAGGHDLQELWVPAKELEDFNNHIGGTIDAVGAVYGTGFNDDPIPLRCDLSKDPSELFVGRSEVSGDEIEYESWQIRSSSEQLPDSE